MKLRRDLERREPKLESNHLNLLNIFINYCEHTPKSTPANFHSYIKGALQVPRFIREPFRLKSVLINGFARHQRQLHAQADLNNTRVIPIV